MRERCLGLDDPIRPLLDRKIASAKIVFREDAPPTLATISSRVTYAINGGDTDTRILTHGHMNAPTGLYLPISTLRGIALLGLTEGQSFAFTNREGEHEDVLLTSVQYQPEAARRDKEAAERFATPEQRRLSFRVVGSPKQPAPTSAGNFDDPGPSAA
ncbi:nucleoside-diphosphate kinase [Mesorhizobium denitrificans]|uniref:Nucleoside-diphosphate kinase n=2 Tax=Phyllobacteriaceae TaxID=69277 RepID=A0A371XC87_9HYPH|nr:nucleoside-diphosphate kinase [Mesorhizobium denitrificans]